MDFVTADDYPAIRALFDSDGKIGRSDMPHVIRYFMQTLASPTSVRIGIKDAVETPLRKCHLQLLRSCEDELDEDTVLEIQEFCEQISFDVIVSHDDEDYVNFSYNLDT